MKYLHKFNENKDGVNNSLIEIKNLCNANLAYLIDEGFKLDFIESIATKNRISEKIYKTVRILLKKDQTKLFRWDDIKDDFIPSIIMLSEKYKLSEHYPNNKNICITVETDKYFSIEDLSEDNIPNYLILSIEFHVFL